MNYDQKLEQYMGLITHLALKYKLKNYDTDDLIQEFSMILLKALDNFDDKKGASFETFFTHYVRMWVHRELTKQKTKKRGKELFILSETFKIKGSRVDYNVMDELSDTQNFNPEQQDYQERLISFIDKELDSLPSGKYTRKFLFEGKSHTDIAREVGTSPSNIQSINKRNLERLKVLLEQNGYLDNLDKYFNNEREEYKL